MEHSRGAPVIVHMMYRAIAGIVFGMALVAGWRPVGAEAPPFGGADSINYARTLWDALDAARMVGKDAILSTPYLGQHPHGAVLDTIDANLSVAGHTGIVIVKRNYAGAGISVKKVADAPRSWLKRITVMFKREAGYDPGNGDWFWADYARDGKIARNRKGIALAGRVAKGRTSGCIACHRAAPGGDLVFNNDRLR